MQLHYPLNPTTGAEDASQLPWTNGVPSTGVEGSYPPFTAVVEPMTELANLIAQAGLTGTSSDLFQVTRAIRGGQLDFDATDIGTANAALCQIGIPYTAIQAGLPFTFIKAASASTSTTPSLTITDLAGNNGITGTIVKNNGSALAAGDLPASALVTVRAISATKFALVSLLALSDILAAVPAAVTPLIHQKLSANLNVYVNSSTGSDTANTGLSAASPFATLQRASDFIQKTYDLYGFTATINVAAGTTYSAGVSVYGLYTGAAGANAVVFSFGAGCSIAASNSSCFAAQQSAAYTVVGNGVVLTATGTAGGQGCGFFVNAAAEIDHSGCNFGACAVAHQSINHASSIAVLGNYTVSGNSPTHIFCSVFGYIGYGVCSVAYGGATIAFSTCFAYALGGYINAQNMTGTGATNVTGQKYSADQWGTIQTGGGGANWFPGSAAGAATASGLYR